MFNTGTQTTITKSVVQSANSGLESAVSCADPHTDAAKVGVWERAFSLIDYQAKAGTLLKVSHKQTVIFMVSTY